MAETRDNGYVHDKLLKREEEKALTVLALYCRALPVSRAGTQTD